MPVTVRQMLKKKKIQGVISISPDATVFEGAQELDDHNIGILVVLVNSYLVGLFGDRDIRKAVLKGRVLTETPIREFMTHLESVESVTMDTEIDECLRIMIDRNVNHLPVIEGEGEYVRVVGVISNKDIELELVNNEAIRETTLSTINGGRT